MFGIEDSCLERFFRVLAHYGNLNLSNYVTRVDFRSDPVHSCASIIVAGFQSTLMCIQAFVFRQQRGVYVYQPSIVMSYKVAGKDTHEAH